MRVNKFIGFAIVFISIFIFSNSVKADEKSKVCEYKYKGENITITLKEDANKNIEATTKIPGKYDSTHDFVPDSLFTSVDQCLETINVCEYKKNSDYNYWIVGIYQRLKSLLAGENHIAVFGSALDPESIDSAIANEFSIEEKNIFEVFIDAWWTGEGVKCTTVEYSGADADKMKENGKFISYCAKFSQMYSNIAEQYRAYGICSNNKTMSQQEKSRCKANAFTKINNETDKLKNTCNNILQHSSISVKDGCARSCLGTNDLLKKLKKRYGLDLKTVNECSISSRLIIWIANIIRWVKYIIPVFVIILGILDFMKATGSSKEDEMKKAQGRFIRRLVAAALIFIAPFIIQFIIEKMGFAANGCGIIDL